MNLGQGEQIAAIFVALVQAASLLFYAGILTRTVREHDRRIEKLEDARVDQVKEIARLEGAAS